jgi:hypothetical protein
VGVCGNEQVSKTATAKMGSGKHFEKLLVEMVRSFIDFKHTTRD